MCALCVLNVELRALCELLGSAFGREGSPGSLCCLRCHKPALPSMQAVKRARLLVFAVVIEYLWEPRALATYANCTPTS